MMPPLVETFRSYAPGKEAADFFEQGKAYYLTFDEAPQG
jgi:hypothetical protein